MPSLFPKLRSQVQFRTDAISYIFFLERFFQFFSVLIFNLKATKFFSEFFCVSSMRQERFFPNSIFYSYNGTRTRHPRLTHLVRFRAISSFFFVMLFACCYIGSNKTSADFLITNSYPKKQKPRKNLLGVRVRNCNEICEAIERGIVGYAEVLTTF